MNCLIAVITLLPLLLLGDAHMTVRLDQTRHYQMMVHIYFHAVRRLRKLDPGRYLQDLPILDQYASLKDICVIPFADLVTHTADCSIFQ